MKLKLYIICIITMCIAGSLSAQVLRSFTPRYSNPSVRGNIVYVSNNIITTSGVNTTEVPPGGSATNNGGTAAYIDIDGAAAVTYVSFGANWKYLANNTRPAKWETTGYSDAAWPAGNGELGYGDGDETTCVPSGGGGSLCSPTGNKWITTYFRKTINIANPSSHADFTLNVKRDDGVAVYINGVEVFRDNLPGGALAHGTLASSAASDDGTGIQSVTLSTGTFVAGNNVIAVEMHQTSATSSDLTFDLELIGNPIGYSTIVPFGANWKYLDNNTRPANWETAAYNDAAWAAGNSELGYGDGDEVTCVASGGGGTLCAPTGNKYVTTYFRKVVNIPNPSSYANFIINLVRDDGAVVYVNGVEVVRSNMPAGAITHGTFAASVVGGAAESTPNQYTVASSYFVSGNNTIAVEVHQENVTSSDISFNLELLGSTDSTFCSSSGDLSLPSCTNVLWAGLYWGASQGTDGTNTSWITGENIIEIKVPGSSVYQTVTASQTDYHNGTLVPGLPHTGYQCFANITSLINTSSPNGTYIIADMIGPAGINNGAGGWTIVFAYADPSTIVRNLTIFDGSAVMNGGDPPMYVPITGFLTPPSGPVSCELGAVVYDGDRVSQDEFSFKQDSNPLVGSYTNMTPNATANLNDMWNSTISYKGSVITTRNPAQENTLGYDADIIEVPNAGNSVLANSQNSASIRFSSPSENYMIQVVSTAISQYTPSFNLSKSSTDVNGGSLLPGEVLRYQLDYYNGGNDASTATEIADKIPARTGYKPGSLKIDGVAKTDAAGDDEAEYDAINNRVVFRIGTGANSSSGGEVAAAASGIITFDVYTSSSCAVLSCDNSISNQARISYNGKISLLSLYDSSGVIVGGCNVEGPVTNTVSGSCSALNDTLLTNICPSLSVMLPVARFAGYQFYSALPFIPGNIYDPAVAVTITRTIYAFYDGGGGSCDDTVRINIYVTACPDIDDDDDGIPDYVEINNPVALQDHDSDGIPNWNDADYPGFVDNNTDGFNDNFDPGADSDNDGIPNFRDPDFPGYVDTNGDGINDNMDKDKDGIPNHLDLDSDNDGIPDVVESFGVDTNGDGKIDNYSDTDNDGLSQNVDANSLGVGGSGVGLGAIDTDGDGVPNYLDLDSDNDGIPDAVEVYGTDSNNDGRIDSFTDTDFDGFSDNVDGDVGNDGTAENSSNALLLTGNDSNNDGRADSYPNKNMDADSKTNPYDLDSDGDGILDVREAGFTDANFDGRIDGALNSDGWNTGVAAMPSLNLPNTDGTGRINAYDIDSDDDGIPDNVEGLPTLSYLLPAGVDTDNDGIDDSYDNFVGFGGNGIQPIDSDGDTVPDYRDTDTDNDGTIDRIEGNDLNFNGSPDDNVTLTGIDTDGDGLDDRFDNNNSSAEATSAYMGNGGSTSGDATPGSITVVQRTAAGFYSCATERDWRCMPYVLSCNMITFKVSEQNNSVQLNWTVLCSQEVDHFIVERSIDNQNFITAANVTGRATINEKESYNAGDNINAISSDLFYYRLRTTLRNGRENVSNTVLLRRVKDISDFQVLPNPVTDKLQLLINTKSTTVAKIDLIDGMGKIMNRYTETVRPGSNTFMYYEPSAYPIGIYYLRAEIDGRIITKKFTVVK